MRLQMEARGKLKSQNIDTSDIKDGKIPTCKQVERSIDGGWGFFKGLQQDDGHWAADYGGPMFLMPGLIIATYVTGTMDEVLTVHHKEEMIRYGTRHTAHGTRPCT